MINIYGFELTKVGKTLTVNQPNTPWKIVYRLDTGVGHLTGTDHDTHSSNTRLHIRTLEDVDQMLKMLKLMRVMIEHQRGDGKEKPDDFY